MNENPTPLSIKIQNAKKDLSGFVLHIQNQYGLPSYIMDPIICSVLSDVREVELKIILEECKEKEKEE